MVYQHPLTHIVNGAQRPLKVGKKPVAYQNCAHVTDSNCLPLISQVLYLVKLTG